VIQSILGILIRAGSSVFVGRERGTPPSDEVEDGEELKPPGEEGAPLSRALGTADRHHQQPDSRPGRRHGPLPLPAVRYAPMEEHDSAGQ
jgi:hypothetical protein